MKTAKELARTVSDSVSKATGRPPAPTKTIAREPTDAMMAAAIAAASIPSVTIHDKPVLLRVFEAMWDAAG